MSHVPRFGSGQFGNIYIQLQIMCYGITINVSDPDAIWKVVDPHIYYFADIFAGPCGGPMHFYT